MRNRRHRSSAEWIAVISAHLRKKIMGIDRFALFRLDLYSRDAEATEAYRGISIARIDEASLPHVCAVFPERRALFSARLSEAGVEGWVFHHDGVPIGYLWVSLTDRYEPDILRRIAVPSDTLFAYDFLVSRDRRFGLAAHHAVWQVMRNYMGRGRSVCITYVNVLNRKAVAFHTFLGTRDTLEGINVLRVLGRPMWTWDARRSEPAIRHPRSRGSGKTNDG